MVVGRGPSSFASRRPARATLLDSHLNSVRKTIRFGVYNAWLVLLMV